MNPAQHQESERNFIEKLRPHFEDKGYEFHPYPDRNDLPGFMEGYEPDAVAVKAHNKVAIEVKSRRNRSTDLSLRVIRHRFEGHPDWQLRVFYISSDAGDNITIPTGTSNLFLERLATARHLLLQGQSQAAFVISWSLLEAAARMFEPDLEGRPQSPGTVVQALAMSGTIDPDNERRLRKLIELRNRVVHGDLGAEPKVDDIEAVLSVAEGVFGRAINL